MTTTGPQEVRLAASLIGRQLLSIEHEGDSDIESAYLRFGNEVIAVAAVDYGGFSGPGWPWRLALLTAPGPLPAMTVTLKNLGRIAVVEFYADQDAVERVVALRFDRGGEAWLQSAGADYVHASLAPLEDLAGWNVSRSYA
jgi:hypothetical protein